MGAACAGAASWARCAAVFRYRTDPLSHQDEWFPKSRDREIFAEFWEQGTGKSKLAIDTAAWLKLRGEIDAVVVIAPSGVELNWVTDEIPTHLSDMITDASLFAWSTKRSRTEEHKRRAKALLGEPFPWVAMSYDAIMTDPGRNFLWKMLSKRKVFYVLDESDLIKSPGAKRSIRLVASGRYAKYKRILTGTPITNSPFDIYSQVQFLDEDFWKRRMIPTFQVFKHRYGDIVMAKSGKREYPKLIGYRRLEELKAILAEIGSRVLKADVLDLPPKVYSKRYFEMSPEQARLYHALKTEYQARHADGELVTAPLAMTRLLRLQQITCGYLPADDDDPEEPKRVIPGPNPRLELLADVCETLHDPCIIWARFQKDVDLICEVLGDRAVRYDGKVDVDERAENKAAFKGGKVQFFVSNPAVGATGLTLTEAKSVIYYNNSFSLRLRLQSEDRAHRIGQNDKVDYTDLVAQGTVDGHIVSALRKCRDVAAEVTGDTLLDWL